MSIHLTQWWMLIIKNYKVNISDQNSADNYKLDCWLIDTLSVVTQAKWTCLILYSWVTTNKSAITQHRGKTFISQTRRHHNTLIHSMRHNKIVHQNFWKINITWQDYQKD